MHRVVLLKIGGKRLHLMKVMGALVVTGSALGILASVASLFRLIKQVELARTMPEVALQVFGLTSPTMTNDVILGFFMGPTAFLLLWIAFFILGALVYRSGEIVIPIEEEIEERKK